ncbi:MAG: DUF3298 domain-containing protein [Bacteroidaceae bacterium]|nr:DUF3298 domain-containing protein [Bacteroidaceae bacterium]
MKLKHLIYLPVAAAFALAFVSCEWFRGKTGQGSDSLQTPQFCTAEFEDSVIIQDVHAFQQLRVDFPAEEDTSLIAQSVLSWICAEVRDRCFPNYGEEAVDSVMSLEISSNTFAEDYVNAYGRKGLNRMAEDLREMAQDGYCGGYSNALFIELEESTERYLTMSLGHEVYTGGAHGGYYAESVTFFRKDGRQLDWSFFDKEKRPELVELLKKGLMAYFNDFEEDKVTTDSALFDHLLLFDDPDTPENELEYGLPLPATVPAVKGDNMLFIYQQYEIAAYALGLPCVSLPLTAVKDCLTEEGKRYLGFK